MRYNALLPLLTGLSLLLLGCTNSTDAGTGGSSEPDHDPEITAAIEDLAQHSNTDAEDIEVLRNRQITWRDGSLGCPENGMMYTQALVEGYHLLLDAAGTEYHYHAGADRQYFYCADPSPPNSDIISRRGLSHHEHLLHL